VNYRIMIRVHTKHIAGSMLPVVITGLGDVRVTMLMGRSKAHRRIAVLTEGYMVSASARAVFGRHDRNRHGNGSKRQDTLPVLQLDITDKSFVRRVKASL